MIDHVETVLGDMRDEVVEYTCAHNGVDTATARVQVREAVRYLWLVSAHPDELSGLFLPVIQDVDEVWHYLILQTREYSDLCAHRLPGRFFVHHRSITYGDYGTNVDRSVMAEQALRWIPLYTAAFGPFDADAARCWKMVGFLVDELGMDLAAVSALSPA